MAKARAAGRGPGDLRMGQQAVAGLVSIATCPDEVIALIEIEAEAGWRGLAGVVPGRANPADFTGDFTGDFTEANRTPGAHEATEIFLDPRS